MKKTILKTALFLALFSVAMISCGPTKEQEELDIKKEDSLADIQSNEALERANQLLESDSLDDTTKQVK